MFLTIIKICCYICLFFNFIQMLPIDKLVEDQFPWRINKINYFEGRPRRIVKRSVFNGLQLNKTFTDTNRKHHCQLIFEVGNSSYVNTEFIIRDNIANLSVSNVQISNGVQKLTGIVLEVRFTYTGNLNLVLNYDFVPSNLNGLETRNATVYTNLELANPITSDYACLQRANFSDSVNTNTALIALLFFAIILVIIIFIILWCIFCRKKHFDDSDDVSSEVQEDTYVEELKLLTEDSNKGYYEKDSRSTAVDTNIVVHDHSIFESELSNARSMDEKLLNDFGQLDDIVFKIWLNSIAEQWPNLKEKLNQISQQRNIDKENIKRIYQFIMAEKFKEIKKNIIQVNNANLARLEMNQYEERERIMQLVTTNDKDEVTANLNKLFEIEKRNVAIQLKVEQEKAFEDVKLKCQADMIDEINSKQIGQVKNLIKQSQLSPEDSDEIMKRYIKWRHNLQGVHENEKIRQAAAIAYLLEYRINQAKKTDLENKRVGELLEKKEKYFTNVIVEYEENKDISEQVSTKILSQFERDKQKIFIEMEKSKKAQVSALLERLNEAKRKKLEDLKTKQANEVSNLMVIHSNDTDAHNLINELVQLKNRHREEFMSVETDTGEQHNADLVDLLQDIGTQTLGKIDEKIGGIISELRYSGFSENDIEEIIDDSNKRIKKIQKIQHDERKKQEHLLQERLQKIKKEIEENANHQSKDQINILEAQYEVLNDITSMHKTFSDDERNQIMELFAKNKSSMESNLVNQRISQRRKMEEAINLKKEEKLKKLEKQYNKDMEEINEKSTKKKHQKHLEETVSTRVSDFVADKLKIVNYEDSPKELDKEMERIRKEILEERVLLIHRKEEEIAALSNKFQISKAAEHVELKEQQEKLKELQMVVLDSMNSDKNVNSVISQHNRDKDILTDSIDMNKKRQEDELRKRLIKKKKVNLLVDNTDRTDDVPSEEVLQRKKQNLENDLLQNDLKSENEKKQFETDFLKKIMESGNFARSDILVLLRDKFPLKTNQEIETMAEYIYPKSKEKPQPQNTLIESYRKITENDKSKNNPSVSDSLRSGSAMSLLSSQQQKPMLEESLPGPKRPTTAKRQDTRQPTVSENDNLTMRNLPEDVYEEIPTIIKPKKKRKKRREREENIVDEEPL